MNIQTTLAPRVAQNLNALSAFLKGDLTSINQYTGWGGLRDAIYDKKVFCHLKHNLRLSELEIQSIKKTFKSAYFTPSSMVDAVWVLAQQFLTETPAHVLEPAVGVGAFIEAMPASLRGNAQIDAVELDLLTARMAQAKFKDVRVHCKGFETFEPEYQYDLIIGNPPFGREKVNDLKHADISAFCIHHYFASKAFRLLKQGGVMIFVLPSFFLDNRSQHVRQIMAGEGAELLTAFRFPEDMFEDAKVTTDIVVIKKTGNKNNATFTNVAKKVVGDECDYMNTYFMDNPEHVLGTLAIVPMYDRKGLTCHRTFDPMERFFQLTDQKSTIIEERLLLDTLMAECESFIFKHEAELKRLRQRYHDLSATKARWLVMDTTLKALIRKK